MTTLIACTLDGRVFLGPFLPLFEAAGQEPLLTVTAVLAVVALIANRSRSS